MLGCAGAVFALVADGEQAEGEPAVSKPENPLRTDPGGVASCISSRTDEVRVREGGAAEVWMELAGLNIPAASCATGRFEGEASGQEEAVMPEDSEVGEETGRRLGGSGI